LAEIVKGIENREEFSEKLKAVARQLYQLKEEEFTTENMRDLERFILLRVVDQKWMDHIDDMEQLKQGINLRAYGNEDPVRAYQKEGFNMFDEMIYNIQEDSLKFIYHAGVTIDTTRTQVAVITGESGGGEFSEVKLTDTDAKTGRNDQCPCGSGKKYKKCCGVSA
jgi:preprotein translocase subunit SecA